ncbi:MAG: hypothetical protein IPM85_10635 [Chitinophagaceae bacterium]|nr:hypothetical protein [Chitinophagaceae bacterium]
MPDYLTFGGLLILMPYPNGGCKTGNRCFTMLSANDGFRRNPVMPVLYHTYAFVIPNSVRYLPLPINTHLSKIILFLALSSYLEALLLRTTLTAQYEPAPSIYNSVASHTLLLLSIITQKYTRMKKHITLLLFSVISLCVSAQIPAGEYICHLNLNQPGKFTYNETGNRFFTMSISETGSVAIKMNVQVREQKTAATNYVLFNGSANGSIDGSTGSIEASGTLVLSAYEREKMDTRWNLSAVITGTAKPEGGVLKATGTIEMTMDNETNTASFTGEANNIDIPYEMHYRLGYDFDEGAKSAFPLAIPVNYTDDNYIVKSATLQSFCSGYQYAI